MHKHQREFYGIERRTILLIVFLIPTIPSLIGLSLIFLIAGIRDNSILFIILFVINAFMLICITYYSYKYYKAKDFGRTPLEPNVYVTKDLDYSSIKKAIIQYFHYEMKTLDDTECLKSAYLCVKRKRLFIRILLMKFNSLDKEDFKKCKNRFNKQINKRENYHGEISMNDTRKYCRINWIVVDELNDFIKSFINQNADILMGRNEGILNVIFCEKKNMLFIPAHYGLENIFVYNQIHKMILECLVDYRISDNSDI